MAPLLPGAGAPAELRRLLRAMNAYDSLTLEGLQVPLLDMERALHRGDVLGDGLDEAGARRQRRVLAHMDTESALEARWSGWSMQRVWSAQMVRDIHQDLFARLPEADLVLPAGDAMVPGALRRRAAVAAMHAAARPTVRSWPPPMRRAPVGWTARASGLSARWWRGSVMCWRCAATRWR